MNKEELKEYKCAITGVGVVSPFGLGLAPFCKAIESGDSSVRPLKRFEAKEWCKSKLSSEVPDFSLEELTNNPKESKKASPLLKYAWEAARQGLLDSGLNFDDKLRERTGIFVGLGRYVSDRLEYFIDKVFNGRVHEILPIRIETIHPHGTALQLSYLYGITGPVFTFAASCQSGVQALESAILYLLSDHIDVAIVLTSDTLSPFEFHAEAAGNILSKNLDSTRTPRPYDKEADGTVLAEGAAALILERAHDSQSRGAKVFAYIDNINTFTDSMPFPPIKKERIDFSGAYAHILENIAKDNFDFIMADGRGIPQTDAAESLAIRKVFDVKADDLPVTSIHGSVGHAGGTSVFFQIIAAANALNSSQIPAIRNLEQPATDCDLDYVIGNSRYKNMEQALVISHGWGGYHSAIIARKA